MAEDRVPIPRLVSDQRSMWLAAAVALVAGLGIAGWGLVTQTGTNRVMAAVVGLLVLVGAVLVLWRGTWVERSAGTLTQRVAGRTRTLPWADAAVDLERNRAGQLNLLVSGDDGMIRVAVLAVDPGGDRSLPPEHLRLLADEIARWAPGRAPVVGALRAQADHLDAGGGVRESPLAARL